MYVILLRFLTSDYVDLLPFEAKIGRLLTPALGTLKIILATGLFFFVFELAAHMEWTGRRVRPVMWHEYTIIRGLKCNKKIDISHIERLNYLQQKKTLVPLESSSAVLICL